MNPGTNAVLAIVSDHFVDYFKIFMGLPTTGGAAPPPEKAVNSVKGAYEDLKKKL